MTRYTLHVPEQYNNGDPVPPEYFAVIEREIEDYAGGWTLTHAIGGWRGEDSRYRESVRLYHVDTDNGPARLLGTAEAIAQALDQEAVYLTAQEISTTLVTSRQEVGA